MRFKTKDLLVTVLPKAQLNPELIKACLFHTFVCRHPTFGCAHCSLFVSCTPCSHHGTCFGCSIAISNGCFGNSCGPGHSACDPTIFCGAGTRDPFVIQHLEDLITLKADLQDTLKQLDAIQKDGLPSAITSKADADAMEKGLSEALEQVRAAKKALK